MAPKKGTASKRVARSPDVTTQLSAIAGLPTTLPVGVGLNNLFYVLSAIVQTVGQNDVDSTVAYKNLMLDQGRREYEASLVDVSGVASTGGDGTVVFRISSFLPFGLTSLAEPVHIVATPHGAVPSFLTVEHTLVIRRSGRC